MKKAIACICILSLYCSSYTLAQNESNESNISLSIGTSNTSKLLLDNITLYGSPTTLVGKDRPGYSLIWDFALGNVVSIGGTFSYNKSVLEVNKGLANEEIWEGKAYGVGGRLLFHLLGEKGETYDPYLGAGLHMLAWGVERTPENTALTFDATKVNVLFPLTAGFRYYISNEFGVGVEYSTSAASKLNLGVQLRF